MTKNQIEYQKLLEMQRANMASEALTRRRDEGTLALREAELSETGRHNKAYELETLTHNRNTEVEATRHNMEVENQGRTDLGIKDRNAATNESQAAARWYDVTTGRMSQLETKRHNMAQEAIQNVSNQIGAVNATANMTQASNAATANRIRQGELDVRQQEADTASRKADASIAFDLARADTERARKENLEKSTGYMGQENVRNWIGLIGNQIHTARQDRTNAIHYGLQDSTNMVKALISMSSLLGG